MEQFILALDSGTTSNRAILFNHSGEIVSMANQEFEQIYPRPGWVEHDALSIWETQLQVAQQAIRQAGITAEQVTGIGITNQRETTVIWDRETGKPVANAIVWQDRRTSDICQKLQEAGHEPTITAKTGLVADAYFSGTKIRWILDNVPGVRDLANQGKLAFGTIDTWLVWKLTSGKLHITDVTNASRTMLFNIHTLEWDQELLDLLDIPVSILPEVKPSSQLYGRTSSGFFGLEIPIGGIAGDQQAALFGQMCLREGMVKNTYGTGCFVVMNTGSKPIVSKNKLLSTIAWQIGDEVTYAIEGSIFMGGAVVQWLRDELGLISTASEVEELAGQVENNGGVYFVQGFVGLGAPHWDQYATGAIIGLSRGTNKSHIARAVLEGIAFRTMEVIQTMEEDAGINMTELRVDGGASVNNLLMQIQSDTIFKRVVRPKVTETTALGAAYLAGLATGFWGSLEELQKQWQVEKKFEPLTSPDEMNRRISTWKKAVERSKHWYTSH
jgi:glycerol kinase